MFSRCMRRLVDAHLPLRPTAAASRKTLGRSFQPATSRKTKCPKLVAGPAPHLPDGRPDFGGDGAWYPGFNGNLAETKWKGVKSADTTCGRPLPSLDPKTYNERVENLPKDDPEASACRWACRASCSTLIHFR